MTAWIVQHCQTDASCKDIFTTHAGGQIIVSIRQVEFSSKREPN